MADSGRTMNLGGMGMKLFFFFFFFFLGGGGGGDCGIPCRSLDKLPTYLSNYIYRYIRSLDALI